MDQKQERLKKVKTCDRLISEKHKMMKLWRRERERGTWRPALEEREMGFFLSLSLEEEGFLAVIKPFAPFPDISSFNLSTAFFFLQGTCHELPSPLFMFPHFKNNTNIKGRFCFRHRAFLLKVGVKSKQYLFFFYDFKTVSIFLFRFYHF